MLSQKEFVQEQAKGNIVKFLCLLALVVADFAAFNYSAKELIMKPLKRIQQTVKRVLQCPKSRGETMEHACQSASRDHRTILSAIENIA